MQSPPYTRIASMHDRCKAVNSRRVSRQSSHVLKFPFRSPSLVLHRCCVLLSASLACRRGFFLLTWPFVHLLDQLSLANGSRAAWISHAENAPPTCIPLASHSDAGTDASPTAPIAPMTPTANQLEGICLPHIPRPCVHPTVILFIIHPFSLRGRLRSTGECVLFVLESPPACQPAHQPAHQPAYFVPWFRTALCLLLNDRPALVATTT